jgi:hypothetical protein
MSERMQLASPFGVPRMMVAQRVVKLLGRVSGRPSGVVMLDVLNAKDVFKSDGGRIPGRDRSPACDVAGAWPQGRERGGRILWHGVSLGLWTAEALE